MADNCSSFVFVFALSASRFSFILRFFALNVGSKIWNSKKLFHIPAQQLVT